MFKNYLYFYSQGSVKEFSVSKFKYQPFKFIKYAKDEISTI